MKNFILCCFLILNGFTYSIDYFSETSILSFADSLYEEGDYKGALVEYKRLFTLDKRKTSDSIIYLKIALCYEKMKNFKRAIDNYKLILPDGFVSYETIQFKIAYNTSKIMDFSGSLNIIKSYKGENLIFDKTGTLYTLNLISLSNFSLAKEMLLRPTTFDEAYYQSLTNRLLSLIDGYKKLPEKNPLLAAFFSTILPGSGKFYSEKWFDGLFSFSFIASMAISSGIYFYVNGISSWQAWVLAGTGFVFYIGDIYGAYKAAENYNKKKKEKLDKEKEELLDEIAD